MTKKKLGIIALASISFFSLAGVTISTVSWFVASMKTPEYNLKGKSAGAYFAYGDGKPYEVDNEGKVIHRPFGISIPRHLYNLSWLQYTGQFADDQYYFEIADTVGEEGLDMDGYILPPIGTTDNPFIGDFNGKGKIITNLTVSNDEGELFGATNKHPDQTQVSYTAPEIVGLFGVVGNYNDSFEGTYDSSINSIHDLGISNATIETTTSRALVGICAGYVDAEISNVAVNESTINVETASTAAVDATNLTANLSDYGTVGYCTEPYKKSIKKMEQELYDIEMGANAEFNAVDDGDSEGWGGSINMKTIYNRIVSLRKNKSTDVSAYGNGTHNWRVDHTYYNNEESLPATTYNNINRSNSTNDAYSRYVGANESGHEYIGNYNIYARAASSGYGDSTTYGDQQYLYLCGGHVENHTYHTYYEHTGVYITDGSGHYLRYNNGTLENATSTNDASLWTFTQYSGSQYYITTTYNGTTYYLNYNNGALNTANSTGTTRRWTVTENGNNLTISYNTSKIYYYGNSWTLIPTTDETYYTIQTTSGGTTHYVSVDSTTGTGSGTVVDTTNLDSAAHFQVESGTNYVYFLKNGSNTKYYLTYYYRSRYGTTTQRLTFVNNTGTNYYYYFTYSGGNLTTTYNNNTYYVRYNNGWTYDTTNRSISLTQHTATYSTYYLNNTFDDDPTTVNGPDSHQTSADTTKSNNESHMYYTATDTTYFPLNVEQDLKNYVTAANTMNTEISSGNLDPKDSNTGYIISGSNIPTNATTLTHAYSDIRISRYGITNVSASYNKSSGSSTTISDLSDSSIYTINSSNTHQTMSAALSANSKLYPRYSDSKTSFFQNSLASSTNGTSYTTNAYVYGLHFMDSTISKDAIVNAQKVSILGNKCDTYQFPVDCIDFNLKQKGVINFFAGTYYTDNNSFFSLHEIIRNNDAVVKGDPEDKEFTSYNTINQIKEIEEIWSNDDGEKTTKYANIYKYKGATGNDMYSVPYRVDGNQNKFVMNKNDTTDNTTAYTYATMGTTDFNAYCSTYGYSLKFKTSQIGKQNSAYTTKRIYYFEFPMNPGEYCLGSVPGGTGAYLLYLDIGANAAKTQRTTIYEHFKEIRKIFEYPAGVAVVPVSVVASNLAGGTDLDDTDTANFLIIAGTNGTITVTRAANDVTMARTGGLLTSAKPTMIGDLMWDSQHQQYNIHKPSDEGSTNLTSEIVSDDTVTDVRRLQYYDYNVNLDELMITHIIDTSTDGGSTYERTYYQEYANGESTTDFAEMRIYHSVSGAKYMDESDLDTVHTYVGSDATSVNNTLIFKITYQEDDGENITSDWLLELQIDGNATGRYYIFQDYVFEATVDNGSVTLTVVNLGSKTIKINSTTITQVGQTVTITPSNP